MWPLFGDPHTNMVCVFLNIKAVKPALITIFILTKCERGHLPPSALWSVLVYFSFLVCLFSGPQKLQKKQKSYS